MHKNPDGDTLGTGLALAQYVQSIHVPFVLYCATPVTSSIATLPLACTIVSDRHIVEQAECDVIVACDAGDAEFVGLSCWVAIEKAFIINIDHHPTNTLYGALNIVVPGAASTTEVLLNLFRAWRIAITPTMATLLLLGLIVDTDEFSNPGTSASALASAGVLVRSGANFSRMRSFVRASKRVGALKIWGTVLERLGYAPLYDVAFTMIVHEDTASSLQGSMIEGIPNFLNCLRETSMTIVLKEMSDGRVHCSFRTVRDDIDVGALAKRLGGGGHRKAAGFFIRGRLEKDAAGKYTVI